MNSFGKVCNWRKDGPEPQEAIDKERPWQPAPDNNSIANGATVLQRRPSLGMTAIILLALVGAAGAGESGPAS